MTLKKSTLDSGESDNSLSKFQHLFANIHHKDYDAETLERMTEIVLIRIIETLNELDPASNGQELIKFLDRLPWTWDTKDLLEFLLDTDNLDVFAEEVYSESVEEEQEED